MGVKIRVRLLGVFRGFYGKGNVLVSLKIQQPTVLDVVERISKPLPIETRRMLIDPELNDPRPNALILLNGKEVSVLKGLGTKIRDGDEVTLIPVAHGG